MDKLGNIWDVFQYINNNSNTTIFDLVLLLQNLLSMKVITNAKIAQSFLMELFPLLPNYVWVLANIYKMQGHQLSILSILIEEIVKLIFFTLFLIAVETDTISALIWPKLLRVIKNVVTCLFTIFVQLCIMPDQLKTAKIILLEKLQKQV